ncbi:hypothetical protein [Marinoscillum sp.]
MKKHKKNISKPAVTSAKAEVTSLKYVFLLPCDACIRKYED